MKKQKILIRNLDKSPEALRDTGAGSSRPSDKEISNWWDQFLNVKKEGRGELKPGQEVNLRVEPAIDYARELIQAERKLEAQNQSEIKLRIQEILVEIKKLTKASKELEVEFKEVVLVEQMPEKPGKYHLNFVEWVLSWIRNARTKVESAVHWTNALKSKKSQRQYWVLFKKHGTMFGLSGERIVATQTG